MKKGRIVATVSGVMLTVSLIASLLLGSVNILDAQGLAPNNGAIGVPVNQVAFSWSPFGETTKYKFQLARNAAMTQIVKEVDVTTTAYTYDGILDYSTNYFWRVMAIEPAPSDWSATFSFTTEAAPVPQTLQILAPSNGSIGISVNQVVFSWSPFKETTKYKFVLAKDAAMTQVVKEVEATTTAYEYDGTLDYSTNYFWRVMALEPAPSDWSATFSFQTEAMPAPQTAPPEAPKIPLWVWVVIAIGAILMVVTLVLIFKTRRT